MKKFSLLIFLMLFMLFGCSESEVACTTEAKICQDSSTVSRVPPDCQFATCPPIGEHDGVSDTVVDNNMPDQEKEQVDEIIVEENKKCSEPIIFNQPPVNLDKVGWIVPLGAMNQDHVTPTDHQYYQAAHDDLIEVISPGKGKVTTIEKMGEHDWRLIIRHTCSIESIYIHIDKLSNKLMKYIPAKRRTSSPQVEIEEGEILGWYDNNVDYNVVDYDIEIGLINKKSFSVAEPWKIHVQDPFLYFNEKIKNKMIALSQRSEEPFGGKIDYDVSGKLIGMWFLEGTNGYAGLNFPSEDYHQGHLAIVPNPIDPSYIMVSVGTYNGETTGYQFGVGNVDPIVEKAAWDLYNFEYEKDGEIQHRWGVPKGSIAVNRNKFGKVSFEIVGEKLKADFGDGIRYYVR